MTKESDVLEQLITTKIDAAMKPLLEKFDAFINKPDDDAKLSDEEKAKKKKEAEDKAKAEKKDSEPLKLATEILKANLKGRIKKEKLDAMTLKELHLLNQYQAEIDAGGIRNPIDQKEKSVKTDASSEGMWGVEMDA